MKKLIPLSLLLLSANILQAGNTHSGLHAGPAAPALNDEQLLEGMRTSIEVNDPGRLTDVLIMMNAQGRLHRLINRYIQALNNPMLVDEYHGSRNPCTALHLASHLGHIILVNILLDWGANIDGINRFSEDRLHTHNDTIFTPLQLAALAGQSLIVQQLLQRNANPNFRIHFFQNTPLHCAVLGNCSAEAISMLVAKGATLDSFGESKLIGTPLHCAALIGNEIAARALLESIANPEDKRKFIERKIFIGGTALHNAAGIGNCPIIRLLLDNGANIHAESFIIHATPLMIALENGHGDAANLLISRGALH